MKTSDSNKEIEISKLDNKKGNKHFPLSVHPYTTAEGNEGFAIFTNNDLKLIFETGSYGYDTYFSTEGRAKQMAAFLEHYIN